MKSKRLLLCALSAALLSACGPGEQTPPPPESLVSPDAELATSYPDLGPDQAAILSLAPAEQAMPFARTLEAAGVPFCVSLSTETALRHRLVLLPLDESRVSDQAGVRAALKAYVSAGGVLVVQANPATPWPELTGVRAMSASRRRKRLVFSPDLDPALARLAPHELSEIPLAAAADPESIWTFGLRLAPAPAPQAQALAVFPETGETAVARARLGAGSVYTLGLLLRDAVVRPQAQRDFDAQRSFSNGFEPGADAWSVFLRGLYEALPGPRARLRALPGNAPTVVLLTYDLGEDADVLAARLWLQVQRAHARAATWFVQAKTAADDDPFPTFDRLAGFVSELVKSGDEVGSLGVSNGSDWETMPTGGLPVSVKDYRPTVDLDHETKGATLIGEAAAGKAVLERVAGRGVVEGFRSPLFEYAVSLDSALAQVGYAYDSSLTAGASLTNRPFRMVAGRTMVRDSPVIELPATFENVTPQGQLPDPRELRRILGELSSIEGWAVYRLRPEHKRSSFAFLETALVTAPPGAPYWTMSRAARFWQARAAARWSLADEGGARRLRLSLPLGAQELSFEVSPAPTRCAGAGVKARCEGDLVIVDAAAPVAQATVELSAAPTRRPAPSRARSRRARRPRSP